ncbi:hypothetical protein M975_2131 [Buttiauxella brennerae ATCC 51605]|uniref:3-phosphoshikimate 1-carboxyvinyltransferase n=1 Tax=Buttiauxella brennerae ATCC 51605 TaxID=1354251 RepID=A0A1B7IR73_9ENTR|nr:hypothetical protein [Buttiauxella brennerae]OAT32239.1 hypothetical protein M975_2131 [Buttiauxella brennerae ATCC 51605]
MSNSTRRPLVIEQFYQVLDEQTQAQLTPEQKQEIEDALISVTLSSRHRIDIRKSFPFFGSRYYMVFLLGRDLRKRLRKESTLVRIIVTILILFGVLFGTLCVLLTLYMLKSAAGIDLIRDFHVGIWDWWLSLKNN